MAFTSVVMYTTNYICLKGKYHTRNVRFDGTSHDVSSQFICLVVPYLYNIDIIHHASDIYHLISSHLTIYHPQGERLRLLVKKRQSLWKNITRTTESLVIIREYINEVFNESMNIKGWIELSRQNLYIWRLRWRWCFLLVSGRMKGFWRDIYDNNMVWERGGGHLVLVDFRKLIYFKFKKVWHSLKIDGPVVCCMLLYYRIIY